MKCRDATCRVTGFSFPHSKRDTSRPYISKQFFNNQSVFSKSNLPTSRLARKRLAAKGFGAGGVAPTRPVNLPCCPSSGHPKSVIRNRITHSRDGLHCPSASRTLPLETTIADPSSFRLNTKRNGRLHGRSHVRSDGRLTFV